MRDDRVTEYQRKEEENQCSNFVSHKYNPHARPQRLDEGHWLLVKHNNVHA